MRRDDVVGGAIYEVKVSGKLVPVRIVRTLVSGGWEGENLITGRVIRIRTARRLRRRLAVGLEELANQRRTV